MTRSAGIRPIDFWRTKYRVPLCIDAGAIESLRGFIQTGEPHVLTFTEVLFVTSGRGTLAVDEGEHEIAAGTVLVTRPGEVRQWRLDERLGGVCAFFEDGSAPNRAPRSRQVEGGLGMRLRSQGFARGLRILGDMVRELGAPSLHTGRNLRAGLLRLASVVRASEVPLAWERVPLVRAFHEAVERRFRELPCVADYAALLGVTPEHLSRTVTRCAGVSPSEVIHRRLLLEAKRRLRFTPEPVHVVASSLGFEYPSYFVRFFKRGVGRTPGAYRRERQDEAPRPTRGPP